MGSTTPLSHKLLASVISASVSIAVGWFVLEALRVESPTVLVVDNSEAIAERMDERLTSAGAVHEEAAVDSYPPPLVREPLDEATAALFFPGIGSSRMEYDPHAYMRRIASMPPSHRGFAEHPDGGFDVGTNELGMREDDEVRDPPPDLRILVTGDSHTDGVCAHSESFPNVLERLLAAEDPSGRTVEVLNAGTGSYQLYNYLGVFERFAGLAPQVFVVTVYGGNDYSGAMYLQRYFNRRPPYRMGRNQWRSTRVDESLRSLGPQELIQEVYFLNHPEDVPVAVDLVCSISAELQRQCSDAGVLLLFVYLPPPSRGQPHHFGADLERAAAANELDPTRLSISDRITDAWLTFLAERGLPAIDLRPDFARDEELLYWRTDHHLNVAGHAKVAGILQGKLESLLGR